MHSTSPTPGPSDRPGQRAADAICARARATGRPALVPYVTAGFPTLDALPGLLRALAPHAAVIEVGVPFSDPMADGVTIQQSSRRALENGATLDWILRTLHTLRDDGLPPIALMSYLNPLLSSFGTGSSGLHTLAQRARDSGVSLLIVPDLPFEESAPLRAALHAQGVGLVQLVSPVTPPERARTLAQASDGFVYAVTVAGVTGAGAKGPDAGALHTSLDALRAASPVPVCAGFGLRSREQGSALAGHADGAIIGSALIDALDKGQDPAALLAQMA